MVYSSGANDAFSAGVNHLTTGRTNEHSITLATAGLTADSARWDAMTPHGVVNTATGAGSQDDSSWEQLQRAQGGYAPGSMPEMQDQLSASNGTL